MNLNLMIDTSNFKPFDIGPALQILHDYRDALYKYQDAMDKIAEEDGQYILPETPENEKYKAIMEQYNADREAVMEDFNRGMNLKNLRELNNIRRRHFSEIVPINKAIEAYNKDVDKITALGPNVTIANRNNRKISDYYGEVNPGIQYRDRKTIQQTAAGVVQGINNALMSAPQLAGTIANQYLELKLEGIDGKDALNAILNLNPNLRTEQGASDVSELIQALNTVYSNFAFDEGTPENSEILGDVVTGAIQGIQAPKYELLTDHSYRTPHEQRMDTLNEAKAKADLNDDGWFKNDKGQWEFNKDAYETQQEIKKKYKGSSTGTNVIPPGEETPTAPTSDDYPYSTRIGDEEYVAHYVGPLDEREAARGDAYTKSDHWVIRKKIIKNGKPTLSDPISNAALQTLVRLKIISEYQEDFGGSPIQPKSPSGSWRSGNKNLTSGGGLNGADIK